MNKRLICLFFVALAYAWAAIEWKTGKVQRSKAMDGPSQRITLVTIVGDDFAYTAQDVLEKPTGGLNGAFHNAPIAFHHGCFFITGSTIKYHVETSRIVNALNQSSGLLYVIDSKGKRCDLEILEQTEREDR